MKLIKTVAELLELVQCIDCVNPESLVDELHDKAHEVSVLLLNEPVPSEPRVLRKNNTEGVGHPLPLVNEVNEGEGDGPLPNGKPTSRGDYDE